MTLFLPYSGNSDLTSPWGQLPHQSPFILPCDQGVVADFDRRFPGILRQDLLPQPFVGNPKAPVVLLLANPGVSGRDGPYERDNLAYASYLRTSIADPLEGQRHVHLDESFSTGPGFAWWIKRLGKLQVECGSVSQKILVLQSTPYRSADYPDGLGVLPSFAYTTALLNAAVERKALIICGRREKSWRKVLGSNSDLMVVLKNPRSVFLTSGNMPEGGYVRLVAALRS